MKKYNLKIVITAAILVAFVLIVGAGKTDTKILSYEVDLSKQDLTFHWKDKDGKILKNFGNLKKYATKQNKELVFAMNGGMYNKDSAPKGLYIEKGKMITKLDTIKKAFGNFYLQPNGVFYINKTNKAFVTQTTDFVNQDIKYATQSGPMLLIDGELHPKLMKGSKNLNIRNGVGILPNGNVLFAMSKGKINFYDFASFFKSKGCKNALYLDGYVSRTYLPEKNWVTTDGNFGVMIAVMEDK